MALTRRLLKELLADREDRDELIDNIIEAHIETVAPLKAQISKLEEQAAEAKRLTAELERLETETPGDSVYKSEYEKLRSEFEAAKAEGDKRAAYEEKKQAFRALLLQERIPSGVAALAMRDRDTIEGLEVSGGKVRNHEAVSQEIRRVYGGFIPKQTGAPTRKSIMAISDRTQRLAAIQANKHLFKQ